MIVDIKLKDGDDPVFISSLSSMIAQLASGRDPHELYVTRVAKQRAWRVGSTKGIRRAQVLEWFPLE